MPPATEHRKQVPMSLHTHSGRHTRTHRCTRQSHMHTLAAILKAMYLSEVINTRGSGTRENDRGRQRENNREREWESEKESEPKALKSLHCRAFNFLAILWQHTHRHSHSPTHPLAWLSIVSVSTGLFSCFLTPRLLAVAVLPLSFIIAGCIYLSPHPSLSLSLIAHPLWRWQTSRKSLSWHWKNICTALHFLLASENEWASESWLKL